MQYVHYHLILISSTTLVTTDNPHTATRLGKCKLSSDNNIRKLCKSMFLAYCIRQLQLPWRKIVIFMKQILLSFQNI